MLRSLTGERENGTGSFFAPYIPAWTKPWDPPVSVDLRSRSGMLRSLTGGDRQWVLALGDAFQKWARPELHNEGKKDVARDLH